MSDKNQYRAYLEVEGLALSGPLRVWLNNDTSIAGWMDISPTGITWRSEPAQRDMHATWDELDLALRTHLDVPEVVLAESLRLADGQVVDPAKEE